MCGCGWWLWLLRICSVIVCSFVPQFILNNSDVNSTESSTSRKNEEKINASLEKTWSSLRQFNRSQKGRLSIDLEGWAARWLHILSLLHLAMFFSTRDIELMILLLISDIFAIISYVAMARCNIFLQPITQLREFANHCPNKRNVSNY